MIFKVSAKNRKTDKAAKAATLMVLRYHTQTTF